MIPRPNFSIIYNSSIDDCFHAYIIAKSLWVLNSIWLKYGTNFNDKENFLKKILLTLIVLTVVAAGTLFFLNGKDTYDASKYSATLSDGLKEGSTIAYTLPDQFDKTQTLNDSIKKLILVFAKDTGHTVKEYLKAQPADYLAKHHTAFIADISPMPVVIRNTFALPDLKKQHYSVALIFDKKISEDFKKDAKTSEIAVATLINGKIEKVEYLKSVEELKVALQ